VLEQRIEQTYGATYTRRIGYGSQPGLGCTAAISLRSSTGGLSIGVDPYRPSRPYLELTNGVLP
jgi:hypothetical protein